MAGATEPSRDLYSFLMDVRARPGMYVGAPKSVHVLESMIHGYQVALHQYEIDEFGRNFNRAFADFVYQRTGWSMSCGWAFALSKHAESADRAFDLFFDLLEDYRVSIRGSSA